MSLILDALRKAEAERQRGSVPGLHGVAAAPPPPAPAPAVARRWAVLPALALLPMALGALAVWAWLGRGSPPAPPGAPAAAAPPVGPVVAPVVPVAPVAPVAVAPLPQVVSAPPPPPPEPAAPSVRAAEAPARPAATATPAAPILTQVRRLAELPPEQRQALPPLLVGGSVWSEQASARFVVLDGQVLREGDTVAPGLVLLKLAPRAATLRWRDSLVEVPF